MLRTFGRLIAILVGLGAVSIPALAETADTQSLKEAHISYVAGASIYVDAGSDDGVAVGQTIEILREGAVAATLKVTFVSSHRSVCARDSGATDIAIGESARFVPAAPIPAPAAPAPAASESKPAERSRASSDFGLHGRIGVRYLYVNQTGGNGNKFSQPALDLRLDGRQMGGSPFDLTVDVRARRTVATTSDGGSNTRDLTNVYRLATSWQVPGSPWRATVGRQLAPSLAVINIFDGAEAEYRGRRTSVGAFTGTQPSPIDLGYSTDIREHGAFIEWHNLAEAERRWSVSTGAVGSYQQGEVNREFSFLQASLSGKRLSMWLAEEVDLNRSWKKQAEGSSFSLTSTFLNLRFRVTNVWSLNAGYDNRRNVRLYRDRITPVTQFDDQYRTGAWVGTTLRFAKHFSVGADARTSAGGSLGGADGYSLYLGLTNLTSAHFDIRTRSTHYTNDSVDGWMHSLSFGLPVGSRVHIELTGGVRDETTKSIFSTTTQLQWVGIDTDVSLGRHLFLDLSYEHGSGTFEASDQGYATVAYRW